MNIEGRVINVNRKCNLAAVDIGWRMALVIEFSADTPLEKGDKLEQLATGYRKLNILNRSKSQELVVKVLADSMSYGLAEFVVSEPEAVSQAA